MITQTTLGAILQSIFQLPKGRIIPKQGNWWNPQDQANSGTWIAYIIRHPRPNVRPQWQEGSTATTPIMTVSMIGTVELQIVGKDAEALAQSISTWTIRPDIHAIFDAYQAQIAYEGLGRYEISNFIQDGANSVLAFNVSFNIQWANMIQVSQTVVTQETLAGGNVTIGA